MVSEFTKDIPRSTDGPMTVATRLYLRESPSLPASTHVLIRMMAMEIDQLSRRADEHDATCPGARVQPPIPLQQLERNARHAELLEDAARVTLR